MSVLFAGFALQNYPCWVQKYTLSFGNKSVNGCSFILFGEGGIFTYKYLLDHIENDVANLYFKRCTKKQRGDDTIKHKTVSLCSSPNNNNIVII